MAQIWLTYDELAALMDRDVEFARAAAGTIPLARRRCHDGRTRMKLNAPLAEKFLDRLLHQRIEQELQACAGDLKAVRDRMSRATGRSECSASVSPAANLAAAPALA